MGRSACICPLASNAGQCRKAGKANLQHVCQSQFHGLASAYAELLSHARSIGVVEKPDFAHARARVRYPLDRVLRKGGDFAFRGLSAQRGGLGTRSLPTDFRLGGHLHMRLPKLSGGRAHLTRVLESCGLFSGCWRTKTCLAHVRQ